jgi:hypothetical protein
VAGRAEHVEVLVEERSMEAALMELIPRIRPDLTFNTLVFPGKDGLLGRLPDVLRGYRRWNLPNSRIVVVVDRDEDDCRELKRRIENLARAAGLRPKSATSPTFDVLTRIAVEELEAWLFGDVAALSEAFPGVPSTLASRRGYRHPDAIAGGTWEALQRVLQGVGYFPAGMPKIEVARAVAARMVPERNRSPSFQAFREGLVRL